MLNVPLFNFISFSNIQFEITVEENRIWNIIVENGVTRKITKEMIEKPTCTFKLSSATILSIFRREITLQQAFFKGRMDIKGDLPLALKMNELINYCNILLKGVSYVEFNFQGVFNLYHVLYEYN